MTKIFYYSILTVFTGISTAQAESESLKQCRALYIQLEVALDEADESKVPGQLPCGRLLL